MTTGRKILLIAGMCVAVTIGILGYIIMQPAIQPLINIAGNSVEAYNTTGYTMYHGFINWWPLLALVLIPAVGFVFIVQTLRKRQRGY